MQDDRLLERVNDRLRPGAEPQVLLDLQPELLVNVSVQVR